jgi:thiosulfate/3-mercaptopyruvate sulfurtransferase
MSPLALPTPLVSTAWLAEHLGASGLKVVDASTYLASAGRNARAEYEAQHIPGAVFADTDWLSDESSPLPHTFPSAEMFAERIGSLGIGHDDAVVVYDGSGQNFSAPRLWFMLRTFGHARVAVLDGGLTRWLLDGHAVTNEPTVVSPAHFVATLDHRRLRDAAAVQANIASAAEQIVDARSAGRFEGTEPEPRAGVRGGHIPGSRNIHYARLVREDGTMRPVEELRAIVHDAGLDTARPVVCSCGSGITACAVLLALEVLGARETAVYDGSWTEWGGRRDTPVATGPAR